MVFNVKDANTNTQPISTQTDAAGNLSCVQTAAAVVAGVAVPVSFSAPLPVINVAGAAASDGSGTVTLGGTAQLLFSGVIPANGYLVANLNASGGDTLYISDVGTATNSTGSSIPIAPQTVFSTPSGYHPAGAVSLWGTTTGDKFSARRW